MSSTVATIGASVVEHVDGDKHQHSPPTDHSCPTLAAQAPSLLEAPPSLLLSAVQLISSQKPILLQGPPKSGRSSLVLDWAYATAARTPCQCHLQPCRCVAVSIILGCQSDSFPLSCREISNKASPSVLLPSSNNNNTWNPAILRRIQVHHVVSVRDVLEYLLTVQGKPAAEQTYGGIIVDDLDILCENNGMLMSQIGEKHIICLYLRRILENH